MKIQIRGGNFKVTEQTEDFAKKKLKKIERYLPNVREVLLELSFQDNKRGEDKTIAELTVIHERGALLRVEERLGGKSTASLEAAINAAVSKMNTRIRRFRGKRTDRRQGRGRYAATLEELEVAEDIPEEEIAVEEDVYENYEPEIVRRKMVALSAMTEDEAIEQMELLGHKFFLFLNQNTGEMNVLYRRDSGDYGVLVPDKHEQA